jgi:hypothetical protein
MSTRKSPDGHGIVCDFSRAKCELHGGKLRECGCHPLWADREWMEQRSTIRIRRRAAVYRRAYERRILEQVFGPANPSAPASTPAPCTSGNSSAE